jgi:hypothetical protein
MIKSFSVKGNSPQNFIKTVLEILQKGELGKITTMTASNDSLIVVFSKLGKSEIHYTLKQEGSDFTCQFKSEKIALAHKAFRSEVDKGITKAFEKAGASIEHS